MLSPFARAIRNLLFIVEEFTRVVNMLFIIVTSARIVKIVYFFKVDLATEREQQLTTVRGLTNGRAANWAPEVAFSPFRAFSCRHLTFPFCGFQPNQANYTGRDDVIRTTTALHDFSFLFQVRILQFKKRGGNETSAV